MGLLCYNMNCPKVRNGIAISCDCAEAEECARFDGEKPKIDEYLMGFVDFYEDFISFNGDTQVIPIEYVQNGHFSTLESVEIPDFSNGKEYFTDAGFSKLIEWCEEYKRQMDEGNSDDDEEGNTVR